MVLCQERDYEEKSVNKIFYDNDRRKTGMKSAFRLCFIYNSWNCAEGIADAKEYVDKLRALKIVERCITSITKI